MQKTFSTSFHSLSIQGAFEVQLSDEQRDTIEVTVTHLKDETDIIFDELGTTLQIRQKEEGKTFFGSIFNISGSVTINGNRIFSAGDAAPHLQIKFPKGLLSQLSLAGSVDASVIVGSLTNLNSNGSGDISVFHAQRLNVSVSGSSDVSIEGTPDVTIVKSGSGDVSIKEVTLLVVQASGSGDLAVSSDLIADFNVNYSGSGDVQVNANIGSLRGTKSGSGDFKIHGDVESNSLSKSGSGDFLISK